MAQIFAGRYTAQHDGPIVVFLIGMRINHWWALRRWVPTAMAMGPMLRTLYQHPEKGFLGGQIFFTLRGPALLQYWQSFEDLDRFARSKDDPHLGAWKRFNQAVGVDGSVGIWHETYLVQSGQFEAVYGNMPAFGLAAVTAHVPAVGRRETARRRLGGQDEVAVSSPLTPPTQE